MRLFGWLSGLLLFPVTVLAQIFVYGGANVNTVHSQFLVGAIQPQAGYQLGVSNHWSISSTNSFRPGLAMELNRRGYNQEIDTIRHIYRLTYFTVYPHMNYLIGKRWSVVAGAEISGLIRARYRQGLERIGVIENYRGSDIALRAELRWQFRPRWGIYAGYTHGLRNLIKYPSITDTGDFVGTIRDVNFRTVHVGVLIAAFNL